MAEVINGNCIRGIFCRTTFRRNVDVVKHPDLTKVCLLNVRSIGNKYAAIWDLVASNRPHLFGVLESWHDSVDDPKLIACVPDGYSLFERARPRVGKAVLNTKTNHGGICLLYSSSFSARQVNLPVMYASKLEVLAVSVQGAQRNALVVVLYWPGSTEVSNAFFEDFDDVIERSMSFACPLIIMGDVNIHLDVADDRTLFGSTHC
jgi:hypothetical protein